MGVVEAVYAPPAEIVRIFSLGRGQTFGGLLDGVLSANEQASLLLAFREHASPRRMRAGTEISLRYLRDGDSLRGIDVAVSPDETVRLDRDELGWRSELIETPVYTDTLYVSGEIETVLWNAVVNSEMLAGLTFADRNELIDHLDRVFQWHGRWTSRGRSGPGTRTASPSSAKCGRTAR